MTASFHRFPLYRPGELLKEYKLEKHKSSSPSIDFSERLNSQQYDVVSAGEGPVLVVAGAGTGKTHALTHRVAYLVDRGTSPDRLLLLTFTNKAANSMTNRVSGLLDENVSNLWSGTFHSIANRILRREAPKLDYINEYTILDTTDAQTLMKQCVSDAEVDHLERRFPKAKVLHRIQSLCINKQVPLNDLIRDKYPYFRQIAHPISQIIEEYQIRKFEMDLMDFDDLLINLRRLFTEFDEVREAYSSKFEHVLVDEYQDINHLQGEIVELFASEHGNLTVVGDDCQSIYKFRGADYDNILNFPDNHPECQTFKLEINYRSTPEILNLANASIHHNEDQFQKTLEATHESGPLPALVKMTDGDQQAAFVCQRILELRDEGVPLSEIAILYRAHYHAMELQLQMAKRGIPFVMRSGLRFFEQAHIKDVLAYLKFCYNPRDQLSFMRLAQQWRGIGTKRSEQIWRILDEHADPLSAIDDPNIGDELPKRASNSWDKIQTILVELRDQRLSHSPGTLIETILEGGYTDYVHEQFDNADNRLEELDQFADYADQYEDLDELLGEITLLTGLSGQEILVGEADPDEHVCLSTVHRAKGLEWTAVFVLWMCEGYFPSDRADGPEQIDEERRLFYVASTRAKKELYLTQPRIQRSRGRRSILRESQFLRELRQDPSLEEPPWEEWRVE